MRTFLIGLFASLSFGGPLCVELVRDPYRDPYLSFAVLRTVERAVLESGRGLSCGDGSEALKVEIVRFEERPIAYTPEQRVSAYTLRITLKFTMRDRSFSVTSVVPYSLPTGGLGDIPRRRAIDDALDKIYLNILKNLRR